jgi:YD repeat-containing protein
VVGVGGQGWEQIRSGGVLSRRYTISPTRLHKIAITLPDGKVEEFDLTVSPNSQGFVPIQVVDAVYSPRALTRGSLRALGETRLVTFGAVGAIDLLTESSLQVFDPQEFEYTTAEGQVVVISRQDGVKQIRDRSGNTVTFGAGGITHSAGKSISFSRDAQNRITTVTDRNGNVQSYGYDINGDLASHTDAEGRSTGLLYNYDHGLIEIRDPRGVRPIRNEYDDAGRLVKTIDAYGKEITYTHDLGDNREVITDRLGNTTIHAYDDQGNVTQTADALGGVSNRSYDARGNTLSEQDPLGRSRSYTYDGQDNRLTETDPLGKTTTYTLQRQPPGAQRHRRARAHDEQHLRRRRQPDQQHRPGRQCHQLQLTTAAACNSPAPTRSATLSSYAYDASGNLTSETDALNRVTSYTYDANGNRLDAVDHAQHMPAASETLLTSFVYDKRQPPHARPPIPTARSPASPTTPSASRASPLTRSAARRSTTTTTWVA